MIVNGDVTAIRKPGGSQSSHFKTNGISQTIESDAIGQNKLAIVVDPGESLPYTTAQRQARSSVG